MTVTLYLGDVHEELRRIPDHSIEFCCCSPPFFALRSYLPDWHPQKDREIGSEATPADWLDVLLELTAEFRRILTPWGSIAIELGDTYAGSGGAGGDYNEGQLRDGQPRFDGSKSGIRRALRKGYGEAADRLDAEIPKNGNGWPLDKSLCGIPTLYTWSLAYGRNLLTGAPSPAGQWRIRNLKVWIRTNPPVGALGDKERPATSYITVACTRTDRWFDLDAVRTAPAPANRRTAKGIDQIDRTGKSADRGGNWASLPEQAESGGAPPLDWWHQTDAIIDRELQDRAREGPRHSTAGTDNKHYRGFGEYNAPNPGARGHHIRKALTDAGILPPHPDTHDISPKGYSGAHYAVWPPELVRQLVDEMCPRKVCTECGQPSRRLGQQAGFGRQPELAAHIKERREALSLTSAEVNGWFGYKEIAKNWERTDRFGAAVPAARDWPTLKERLGLSDDFDDFVMSRDHSVVEYEGERRQDYGRGGHAEVNHTQVNRPVVNRWSDCGHNTWRPGRILDPFTGSGTTLAVATGMGRDAVGIDIDQATYGMLAGRLGPLLATLELTVHWPGPNPNAPMLPRGGGDYTPWAHMAGNHQIPTPIRPPTTPRTRPLVDHPGQGTLL